MKAVALVTCLTLLGTPAVAVSAIESNPTLDCWAADEIDAAHINLLQTKLMVESLKCQDTIPATLESYNAFMNARREMLVNYKHRVEAHFVRQWGTQAGTAASDDYNTKTGNQVSTSTIDVAQCERAGMIARFASTASDEDLRLLAETIAPASVIRDCPDVAPRPGRPLSMVIPIWKQRSNETAALSTVDAAPPTLTAAKPSTAPSTGDAALYAEGEARPVARSTQPVNATDDQDAIAALKAATDALNRATAALARPASAPPVTADQQLLRASTH